MEPGADTVRRITARHGLPATPVEELVGLGSVNRVFVVGEPGQRHVVRFAVDRLRAEEFSTEDWCLRRAAEAGVPSPVPVAHGVLDGVAYGVQRFVDHVGLEPAERERTWRQLGRYARRVNALPLTADAPDGLFSRFGRDLAAAWRAHVSYNLDALAADDPLVGLEVYAPDRGPGLREVVSALAEVPLTFGLSHGDLATRNVLRRADGELVLIDWGSASCGPVPYTDLLVLTAARDERGDPSAADLAAFAAGYGLDLEQVGPTLASMRVLAALDLVRWALERRPDLLPGLVADARRVVAGLPGG